MASERPICAWCVWWEAERRNTTTKGICVGLMAHGQETITMGHQSCALHRDIRAKPEKLPPLSLAHPTTKGER